MLHHEFPSEGMLVTDFTEAEGNVKGKILDILNRLEYICYMRKDVVEGALEFELLVNECDLKDSHFGTDENSEELTDKELENNSVRNVPFETRNEIV